MTSRDVFLKYLAQTSTDPLLIEVEKAEGIYIYSPDGKKYMDLISGIAVTNAGHRHPKVIKAIKDQVDRYLHVMAYGEFIQEPVNRFAVNITSHLPDKLNSVYFVNSGTEANEGAVKLAKRHTGRTEIVSFYNSYHGNTHGSLSFTGNEEKKYAFRPLMPDIRFIHFNQDNELSEISRKTACVIVEPVQGDAGVILPTNDFLKKLRKRCDDTGTLLIFDEVQTGFGRTGKLFAFEHFGAIPDIITLAKGLGGGLPLGAFISGYEIMQKLSHNPKLGHITTFGGNPVCCAAGNAVLEVLTEPDILDKIEAKGELFKKLLQHDQVVEIRQIGLMMAVEFESAEIVQRIVHGCIEKGIITFYYLSNHKSLRIAPPLTISFDEIKTACSIIQEVFDKYVLKFHTKSSY